MNEQMKNIAQKAGFEYLNTESDGEVLFMKLDHDDLNRQGKILETFTQLLLQEVINEIHVADVGHLLGKSYYLDKVAEHIAKHFKMECYA